MLTRAQLALVAGIELTGDFGGITTFTARKGKKAMFPKAWLKDPESPAQALHRAKFAAAASEWSDLTDEEKANWQQACRQLNLRTYGTSLFVSYKMTGDKSPIETIERQTGLTLLPVSTEP